MSEETGAERFTRLVGEELVARGWMRNVDVTGPELLGMVTGAFDRLDELTKETRGRETQIEGLAPSPIESDDDFLFYLREHRPETTQVEAQLLDLLISAMQPRRSARGTIYREGRPLVEHMNELTERLWGITITWKPK